MLSTENLVRNMAQVLSLGTSMIVRKMRHTGISHKEAQVLDTIKHLEDFNNKQKEGIIIIMKIGVHSFWAS